jgi:hypothetical protein
MARTKKPVSGETEEEAIARSIKALDENPVDPIDSVDLKGETVDEEQEVQKTEAVDTKVARPSRPSRRKSEGVKTMSRKREDDKVSSREAPGHESPSHKLEVDKVDAVKETLAVDDSNVLIKYEELNKVQQVHSILVKRITGSPTEWVVSTQPRTAAELYEVIKSLHGRNGETTYELIFRDLFPQTKTRGGGHLHMPNTMGEVPMTMQGQPPMPYLSQPQPTQPWQQPWQPPAQTATPTVQVVPPTIDPVAMMQQMFQMFQQIQASMQQRQTPTVTAQPSATPGAPVAPGMQPPAQTTTPVVQVVPPTVDPVAMMQQMFQMFQQMQTSMQQPPQPSAPVPQPPSVDPMTMMQQMFQMFQQMQQSQSPTTPTSPSPQGSDPGALLTWMQQLFQKMQTPPAQPAAPPSPQMAGMPPVQAPPGMFFVPGFGFVPLEKLFQALSGAPSAPSSGGPYSRPYGAQRPPPGEYQRTPYNPHGDPQYPAYGAQRQPYGQPGEPPLQKTIVDGFREAASVIDMAVGIAERFRPQQQQQPAPEPDRGNEDENPMRIVDVGDFKLVVDKKDGTARKWETGVANLGPVMKFVAEQREAFQKTKYEQEARQQRQPLPQGYVEMTPGYQPPPGYVAVPVDRLPASYDQGLPQPPDQMPPPIGQQEQPQQRRTWGMPAVPEGAG